MNYLSGLNYLTILCEQEDGGRSAADAMTARVT
jgi:hypothetical protein